MNNTKVILKTINQLFTKMKTKSLAYNVWFNVNTGKGKGISSIFKTNPVSSSGDGRQ
jgi:hypothetical protein